MKIQFINYRYFVTSGPERYLFSTKELFEERGHEVIPFSVRYSRNEPTPWDRYFVPPIAGEGEVMFRQHSWSPRAVKRAVERAFYSQEVYDALSRQLEVAKPDVAYILCYLRKLSPSILLALRDHGVPMVVRFSDFAMICSQPHLILHEEPCERCIRDGMWQGVVHRCVQSSLAASAVTVAGMWWGYARRYFDCIDQYICPSTVMKEKMAEAGLPPEKLEHLPTSVGRQEARPYEQRQRRICYVGRIERVKGVDLLLDAFELLRRRPGTADVELVIAGDPTTPRARASLERLSTHPIPGLTLAGQIDAAAVIELMQSSLLSVVPSLWYENSPNALLESLACGTPVVASDLGSLRDMLEGSGAGVLYRVGDRLALADALERALCGPDIPKMGKAAQRLARERHDPGRHVDRLLELFGELSGKDWG